MFAIIFGSRGTNKVMGQKQFICPQCHREAYHTVVRSRRWFTLYFIPVIPLGKTSVARCNLCGFQGTITNEQADGWFPTDHAAGIPLKTPQQWMEEGQAHENAMRYPEALAAYEQVTRLDPRFAGGFFQKGRVLKMMTRYQEALEAYEQAIRLASQVPQAYQEKGSVLESLGRPAEAGQAYAMARQLGFRG